MVNYTIGKDPLLIPEGNNSKREYYINGIKYTEEKWKEMSTKQRRLTMV
jgi:hypothetical protein